MRGPRPDRAVAPVARGDSTAFGFYADALADASFWTWFALRHEPSPTVRVATVTAWGLPAVAVTAAYLGGGRTVDYPRPVLLRNASVALQIVVAARAARRTSTATAGIGIPGAG